MPGSLAPLRSVAIVLCAASFAFAALLTGASARSNQAGDFDYFVLSLSWSPTYCAGEAGDRDSQQCSPGRRFAFVVHGLWPQYRNGGWPEYCATRETWVPEEVIGEMLPVMPSRRLIIHEWKKHGSCSGLSIDDYFTATRLLFEAVRIPARYLSPTAPVRTTPEQLVSDFVKTNRNLTAEMMSVQCGNDRDVGRLTELRVCFDRRGAHSSCGSGDGRQCRARQLLLPPVR